MHKMKKNTFFLISYFFYFVLETIKKQPLEKNKHLGIFFKKISRLF